MYNLLAVSRPAADVPVGMYPDPSRQVEPACCRWGLYKGVAPRLNPACGRWACIGHQPAADEHGSVTGLQPIRVVYGCFALHPEEKLLEKGSLICVLSVLGQD